MTREDFLKQLPELVRTYTPASDVANHIKNLDLLMIIGPSGVGKTAIINRLDLKYIVSDTTREPDFRQLGFRKTISVFITPPSFEEWMQRLDVHNLSAEQQALRLSEAARSFEFALNDRETHFILNDDIQEAVNQTKNILHGEVDQDRESDARLLAESLLGNVGYNKVLV
jgi:guanylate kinase